MALTFVIYGTAVDPRGSRIVSHMAPVAIGFTVFLAHCLLVPATGCGINPARSFGSAVAADDWTNQWLYWVRYALSLSLSLSVCDMHILSKGLVQRVVRLCGL